MIKVVYSSPTKEDLFTLSNIHAMCELEDKYITSTPIYQRNCIKQPDKKSCCRPLSLGNYIAIVTGKSNCSMITEGDVTSMRNRIRLCVGYYHNFSLNIDCDRRHSPLGSSTNCSTIPEQCKQFNAVYNVMHFISDRSFQRTDTKLKLALSFLPVSFLSTTSKSLMTP